MAITHISDPSAGIPTSAPASPSIQPPTTLPIPNYPTQAPSQEISPKTIQNSLARRLAKKASPAQW